MTNEQLDRFEAEQRLDMANLELQFAAEQFVAARRIHREAVAALQSAASTDADSVHMERALAGLSHASMLDARNVLAAAGAEYEAARQAFPA